MTRCTGQTPGHAANDVTPLLSVRKTLVSAVKVFEAQAHLWMLPVSSVVRRHQLVGVCGTSEGPCGGGVLLDSAVVSCWAASGSFGTEEVEGSAVRISPDVTLVMETYGKHTPFSLVEGAIVP